MTYDPQPRDLSRIELPPELGPLVDLLEEHVHDLWARRRMDEGWVWGPVRNDTLKHHPCLVPTSELPDSERAYDRGTALSTLRSR